MSTSHRKPAVFMLLPASPFLLSSKDSPRTSITLERVLRAVYHVAPLCVSMDETDPGFLRSSTPTSTESHSSIHINPQRGVPRSDPVRVHKNATEIREPTSVTKLGPNGMRSFAGLPRGLAVSVSLTLESVAKRS